MEYIFILKYQLSEQDRDHADIVERLGGGGCDDALVGIGLTDVADAVGMSRQNLRKLRLAYPGSFPAQVHEGSTVLWHLTDVLGWLKTRGPYPIAAEVARTTRQVNLARGAALVEPELQLRLRQLLA